MKKLVFTPAAQVDIERIWNYSFKEWGVDQAERYIKIIRDTCQKLASGYKQGREVDIRQDYLKYPSGHHMIYFLEHSDRIEVVRILHGKQDVQQHLFH